MQEVTLQINGREMTFSEQELTAIVEKHLGQTMEVTRKLTEDRWFDVNPKAISQDLFKGKRIDKKQEMVRHLIIDAFAEVQKNPEYERPFKTMMPKKNWSSKTVMQFEGVARDRGGKMANWIQQALEWAQRLTNGETWEAVCNVPDCANWYRLIIWKSGNARLVGGAISDRNNFPAATIHYDDLKNDRILSFTVPLIVSYDE